MHLHNTFEPMSLYHDSIQIWNLGLTFFLSSLDHLPPQLDEDILVDAHLSNMLGHVIQKKKKDYPNHTRYGKR